MTSQRISNSDLLYGALSLTGALLTAALGVVWNQVQAHESAIGEGRVDRAGLRARADGERELLVEVRSDVKEIRDAVRRLEGHASND